MTSNKRNHADVLDCRSGIKETIGPLVERVEPGFPVSPHAENQGLYPPAQILPYPTLPAPPPTPDSRPHTNPTLM